LLLDALSICGRSCIGILALFSIPDANAIGARQGRWAGAIFCADAGKQCRKPR